MNRFLLAFIIGALLALIAYTFLRNPCPPANQISAQWKKNSADYHAGKISFDELIRRSDKLIDCIEKKIRERLESPP